jgi:predicted DsbA family dithiol-disulfide isomerase
MWDAGAVARDVAETEQQMRALDISGVPFFILERKLGVSGAQAPEALIAAIRQASN